MATLSKDVPEEELVTLRMRRCTSGFFDADGPNDWSIRLRLSPSGSVISGSRRVSYFDRTSQEFVVRRRFRVSRAWAADMARRLEALRIPAIPDFILGCGGEYKELVCEGAGGRAAYRWWTCPPAGWEEMDALYEEVYALFGAMESIGSDTPGSPYVRLRCMVAGTSHVAGIMELTEGLEAGSSLRLERDEGNAYDANAIAVLTEAGARIGFIPKAMNVRLAELMATGVRFSAVVSGVGDKGGYREIAIHVIEHRKDPADVGRYGAGFVRAVKSGRSGS